VQNWPRFLKSPDIQYVGGKRPWVLKTDAIYLSDVPELRECCHGVIQVPAGYRTDLASVPRLPLVYWRAGGKAVLPAVLHDWLYEHSEGISRKAADDVFAEAMLEVGDPAWASTRWMMYRGVRLGGGGTWRRYRKDREPVLAAE
jgi:hypothetical protein